MIKKLIKMILDLLEEEFPETYHSIPDSVSRRSGSWFILWLLTIELQGTISNMPLLDFLSIAGISFPPEIPAKDLRRRSTYNVDYGKIIISCIRCRHILITVIISFLRCSNCCRASYCSSLDIASIRIISIILSKVK